jgi:hypothetical protein
MGNYLGELGLIVLGLILLIILAPIFVGMGVGFLFGLTGISYYSIVILVSVIIWICLWIYYYK